MSKERLDKLCVARGLVDSRQRAQALIGAGELLVDGVPATKAGTLLDPGVDLSIRRDPLPYVSRGGLKLAAALDAFDVDCRNKVALDVGASTGGFTDCLLQRGARHVVAVDVGYGQLAWKLRQDERVTVMERTNARYLQPDQLAERVGDESLLPPNLATVDVSFISLTLVLPAVVRCVAAKSLVAALVKPQFEAGRADVGRGGVVRDEDVRRGVIDRVTVWVKRLACHVVGGLDSPISGPKGNIEHLLLIETPRG